MYTVVIDNVTYTAAGGDFDLLELVPASNKPITLCAMELAVTSEVKEAEEEWVRLRVTRWLGGTFTSGSGGSVPTPRPLDELDTAASFTAEVMNSTVATSTGTQNDLWLTGFNERAGYGPVMLPPEFRVPLLGVSGNAMVVRAPATLADDASISGTFWVEEG
jgi:hypothetical protein